MAELLMKPKLDSEFISKAVIKLMKRDIFDRFIKTGRFSDDDHEFCDKINWYPIDELPVKEEYLSKLDNIVKAPHSAPMSPSELDKWFDKL